MSVEDTKRIKGRISNKHGTEADWYAAGTAANPFCPLDGELIIYDPDAIYQHPRTKYGAKDENGNLIPVHLLPWASGCDESVGLSFKKDSAGRVFVGWGDNIDSVVKIPRGFCGEPVYGTLYKGFVRNNGTEVPDVLFIPKSVEKVNQLAYNNSISLVYCEVDNNLGKDKYDLSSAKQVIWGAIADALALNKKFETVAPKKDSYNNLIIENGIVTEGNTSYAKTGNALGIETYSGSKSFTIWGIKDSTTDSNQGTYLVDGISTTDDNGVTHKISRGDEYSCHVCYTDSKGTGSRQRSLYGTVIGVTETGQTAPNGKKLYEIYVSPFFGIPAGATFRPFITNEDGSISELEQEYLDSYGVDQERNTFRIPSKPLLGYRTLGAYAYATGYDSSANTRGAFTFGRANIADGNYAGAIGFGNEAAYAAFATGNNTKAIGIKSFTQGANTEAYQEAASAMGVSTVADGYGAQATGVRTRAEGQAANSEGEGTKSIGNANHAEGKNTTAGMKWTKIEKVVESGLYWPRPKNHTIENEFFTGSIDYSKIVFVDAPWSGEWGSGIDEDGYKLNGYVTITIDSVADREDIQDYFIAEHLIGAYADWADSIPLETGTYTISVKDYSTSYEVWGPEGYGYTYADCGGFSAYKELVPNGPALILESTEGYTLGDTYSVLQTDYDTSYIDAGKITSIGLNHICVDKLPIWKDLKYEKGLSDLEIIELSFSEEETSNDIVTSYINLSSALAYPITISVESLVGYNGNYYMHKVYNRVTIPKGSTHYALTTHPSRFEYDENSWGDITLPIEHTIEIVEGFPSTTTYEQKKDSLTIYDIHETNIVISNRYIGIRTKPNVGRNTLGFGMHAEGNNTQAWYTGAHAGGQNAIASSTFAFAHGAGAKATSRHAIALGDNATANGAFSAAIGQFTKTEKSHQVAVGKYNDPLDPVVPESDKPKTPLFMVGNGTADNKRSNAFVVTSDGKAYAGGKRLLTTDDSTGSNVPLASITTDGLMSKKDKTYIEQVKTNLGSHKVLADVPADAKFTDTVITYELATKDKNGLMGKSDKIYIEQVKTNLGNHTVAIDVPSDAKFTDTDTTYGVATASKDGLLSKDDKSYLDRVNSAVAVGTQDTTFQNSATGVHSFATGRSNKALQKSAVATGINTIAYGFNSLTNGDKSIAFGNNSVAFGGGVTFSGTVSSSSNKTIKEDWEKGTGYHAALNQDSEVHGRSNLAIANKAFVTGFFNRADTENQFVAGKYNDYSSAAALVVGDGEKNNRSNAFEVFGKSDSAPAHANIGGKKVATEEFVSNNLTDYVKNTDYATATAAGVVKVRDGTNGLKMYNNGLIGLNGATQAEVLNKTTVTHPLYPYHIDNIVKAGIASNQNILGSMEKHNAQHWLGIDEALEDIPAKEVKVGSSISFWHEQDNYATVGFEIYPALSHSIEMPIYYSFQVGEEEYHEGTTIISIPAGETSYVEQLAPDGNAYPENVYVELSPGASEDSNLEFTDSLNAFYITDRYTLIKGDKVHASRIFVEGGEYDEEENPVYEEVATKKDIEAAESKIDNQYVKKLTPSTSFSYLYGIKTNGEHFGQAMSTSAAEWTVASRVDGGRLVVGDPTQSSHAATKGYVDNLVGDIDSVLDSILAIQESLIGGNS